MAWDYYVVAALLWGAAGAYLFALHVELELRAVRAGYHKPMERWLVQYVIVDLAWAALAGPLVWLRYARARTHLRREIACSALAGKD